MQALTCAIAWEQAGGLLTYAQEQELCAEWPGWVPPSRGGTEPLPQYDWYVALRIAESVNVDLFRLYQLPLEPPFTDFVQWWVLCRINAEALAHRTVRPATSGS